MTTDIEIKKKTHWNADTASFHSDALGEPNDLRKFRLEALKRLELTPFPTMFRESWRRTDPGMISPEFFKSWNPHDMRLVQNNYLVVKPSPPAASSLVMHNAIVQSLEVSKEHAEMGIKLGCLADALVDDDNRNVVDGIRSMPDDQDSPAISLMQLAFYQGGVRLDIPDNIDTGESIYIRQTASTPGSALFPLSVINIGSSSRVSLIIEQDAFSNHQSWFAGLTKIDVGNGAELDLVLINRSTSKVRFYERTSIDTGRDSKLNVTFADLTGGWAVIRRELTANQPGSESRMQGIHIGSESSHLDLRTLQNHPAPDTFSDMLFKSVLFEKSKSIYQGLIRIAPGAVNANAYQLNRNLLMSSDAHADSIPRLEILVDEVKCSHGASMGKIDKELLFYIMSRGLTRREAMRVLVEAFVMEVGERIGRESSFDYWRGKVIRVLEEAMYVNENRNVE